MQTKNKFRGVVVLALLGVASFASATEWNGTMSCGALQNATNPKTQAPWSGPVTLTIDGKNAVFDRKWATGKEQLQGPVTRGQPLILEGRGWFFNKEADAWKTSVTLIELGPRYEGIGTIESRDGKTKYRDCTVSVVDVARILDQEAAQRASVAEQSAQKTNIEAKEKRPVATVKQADVNAGTFSTAKQPTKAETPSQAITEKRPVALVKQAEVKAGTLSTAKQPTSPAPTASAAESKSEAVDRISTPLILTCQISRDSAKRYFFLSDGVTLEQIIEGQGDKSYTFMWIAGVHETKANSFKVHRTATYKSFNDVERKLNLLLKKPAGPPTEWEPMDGDVKVSYQISLEPNRKVKLSITEQMVDGVSKIKDVVSYNCINESENVEIKKNGETIRSAVPSRYFGVKKSSEPSTTSKHSKDPGSNSVEGLASKGQPIYYNFQAQKGVDIRLSVESEGDAVVFHLYPPSAAALIAKNIVPPNRITSEPMRQFNYQATESGTYVVGVGFPRGQSTVSARFKLNINAREGLGNLLSGIGGGGESEKSVSPKISTNGCTLLPSMDGGRPITLTASQAWEEMRSARERAIRDQNLARSKNDYCRAIAGQTNDAISNWDKHLVDLSNNKYVKDEYIASQALALCHAYANTARLLSGCK